MPPIVDHWGGENLPLPTEGIRNPFAGGLQASFAAPPCAQARDLPPGRWDKRCTNADGSTRSTSDSSPGCLLCSAACERRPQRPAWRGQGITHGCNRSPRAPAHPTPYHTLAKYTCKAWPPPLEHSPECSKVFPYFILYLWLHIQSSIHLPPQPLARRAPGSFGEDEETNSPGVPLRQPWPS